MLIYTTGVTIMDGEYGVTILKHSRAKGPIDVFLP